MKQSHAVTAPFQTGMGNARSRGFRAVLSSARNFRQFFPHGLDAVLGSYFFRKHAQEGYDKKEAAEQNGFFSEEGGQGGPQRCAEREKDDDFVVAEDGFLCIGVSRADIMEYLLGGAAEIAGAHGRRHTVPIDFSETFHLYGTDEGNQDVDGSIPYLRGHEGRKKEKKRLKENNDLPPVKQIVFLEFGPYPLREQDAQGKRDDGEKVKGDFLEVAFRKIQPKEHDIPRLCVGKDLSPRDVRVDIKETSRHRQQGAEQE